MKLPRDVSGLALVRALCRDWGYTEVNQVGSHIMLQTRGVDRQTILDSLV